MIDRLLQKIGPHPWPVESVVQALQDDGVRHMTSFDLYSLVMVTDGDLNTAVKEAKILVVTGAELAQ